MNAGFLAELQKKTKPAAAASDGKKDKSSGSVQPNVSLMAALKSRKPPPAVVASNIGTGSSTTTTATTTTTTTKTQKKTTSFREQPFEYCPGEGEGETETPDHHGFFLLVSEGETSDDFVPRIAPSSSSSTTTTNTTVLEVPLAPLVYRACDFTLEKAVRNRSVVTADHCVRKLGILRALRTERDTFNALLHSRLSSSSSSNNNNNNNTNTIQPLEEEELGKTRFLELLSNGGVSRRVIELLLKEMGRVVDIIRGENKAANNNNNNNNTDNSNSNSNTDNKNNTDANANANANDDHPLLVVAIDGLDDLLDTLEKAVPELATAREEIATTQSVSFYPGLGELFRPGSKLVCYPEGMEGSPLGCSCVQSWYSEDHNHATGTTKRRFVLVIEFLVSVGDELVFVAMTDVYPEFHDTSRNVPLKDLSHRRLCPEQSADDAALLERLRLRGEFYASVATKNHFLEYHSDSFFPILKGGGWSSNAVRPLSKGGRVMVDVKRGILEGHFAVRGSGSGSGSGDATSDTVKEAIKLFESSKRTGIAVPFRTCVLPPTFRTGSNNTNTNTTTKNTNAQRSSSSSSSSDDRERLWMSWPMLVGFSFTARVWGKLLLGMPKLEGAATTASKIGGGSSNTSSSKIGEAPRSPRRGLVAQQRPSSRKFGVEIAALGGEGRCGNCGYISFQTQAFDQLVLAEDKKELIRAVARNAGGGSGGGGFNANDDNDDDYDSEDDDDYDDVGIDVVANKGGASIFLLHGPPGCGKTLTAEAIAELLEKPLYIVTAGDLGISASEVETNLGSVLELCQTWDALVLIDEADVFLEARNSTEIARNALVCVMLRLLEYYSGCLFLSSNRSAGSIDAAIASRITVMLGYPKLDAAGRSKVWKNLIELVPVLPTDPTTGEPKRLKPKRAPRYRIDFTASEYAELAERFELNGRQIKNSIVLARALARERGTPLNLAVLHRAVVAVAGENVAGDDSSKNNHY